MENPGFPEWLKKKVPVNETYGETFSLLRKSGLNTVCENAKCPNMGECFSKKTATFLILGNICTRGCSFCDINLGAPEPPDREEPEKLLAAVRELGLKYVVITSVTRDDLPDGGAGHFKAVLKALKTLKDLKVELLIPDFNGNSASLKTVVSAGPDVIGHNVEMPEALYAGLRPVRTNYRKSLQVLKELKQIAPEGITKSGFMVGLGEKREQVFGLIADIFFTGCDILTIGQYLRPSKGKAEVKEFVTPEGFESLRQEALRQGFKTVYSGPFVRSSFGALELYRKTKNA